MKRDVLTAYIQKQMPQKRPSKETLNHTGLIYLASDINPYENTQQAFLKAYESLGIDVINRVPSLKNVKRNLNPGESKDIGGGYQRAYLGLYDTFFKNEYEIKSIEEFFQTKEFDFNYNNYITPVPHALDSELIKEKEGIVGDIGFYYYQYYFTLFMWAVESLGWEVFMMAAAMDPDEFDKHFLQKAFETTKRDLQPLLEADVPFVWLHDDIASKLGPMFNPDWYDEYIFPRYKELWKMVHDAGKLVIFVGDGNMDVFIPRLYDIGTNGVFVETPATNFDLVSEVFSDRIFICGMDTYELTFGTEDEIAQRVKSVANRTINMPGFTLTSPGGLHNNIPMENVITYYNARVDYGFTNEGWIKGNEHTAKELI